ncbi:hypothetical protein [uncultured Fluviicola sp.]|uniref:hypothetical protein n=1 Tax=uncultured Fluviicola sp. TaxID=463303 RepID=UPI0025FC88A0|nr:hypothetical protein [uncultured Fluviicola sp.]
MEKLLKDVSETIVEKMRVQNPTWKTYYYKVNAAPSPNDSYSMEQVNLDDPSNQEYDSVWFSELSLKMADIFRNANKEKLINVLKIHVEDEKICNIELYWDQAVKDEYEKYIPASMRGKYHIWYMPQSEPSPPQETYEMGMLKKHIELLPKEEPAVSQSELAEKSLEELYRLFDPYIRDNTTTLWDGGLIEIKENYSREYSGEIMLYYFHPEDSIKLRSSYAQIDLPNVTERMISIYQAIQLATKLIDPGVKWNSLYVSIEKNGIIEANYEMNGEEVFIK